MLLVILENSKGKQIQLTQNEVKFKVGNITGLNPPAASISITDNIGDGGQFQYERTGTRNIVVDMYIEKPVEENRLDIYHVLQNGKYIKVYLTTYNRNVWIEGYVESVEINNFEMNTTCQISILCPEPWFKDAEETLNSINTVKPKFIFPFAIVDPIPFSTYETIQILNLINKGNIASGMTIEINAVNGSIVNPIIYNRETREFIGLGTAEKPYVVAPGDKIVITTHTNNKTIKLIRNAVETNIFNYLTPNSTFLQVGVGDNIFTYSADEGNKNIDISFKHYSQYEGI